MNIETVHFGLLNSTSNLPPSQPYNPCTTTPKQLPLNASISLLHAALTKPFPIVTISKTLSSPYCFQFPFQLIGSFEQTIYLVPTSTIWFSHYFFQMSIYKTNHENLFISILSLFLIYNNVEKTNQEIDSCLIQYLMQVHRFK